MRGCLPPSSEWFINTLCPSPHYSNLPGAERGLLFLYGYPRDIPSFNHYFYRMSTFALYGEQFSTL